MSLLKKKWYKRWWGILIIIGLFTCVFFTLGFAGIVGYYFVVTKRNNALYDQVFAMKSEDRDIVEKGDDPFTGNETAPLVVVEFADFQCTFCRQEFFVLNEVMKKYKNEVKLIFRDFPVESLHKDSFNASLAANCAFEQGNFWAYHEKLYINQTDLSVEALKQYAKDLGLDEEKFKGCFNSRKYSVEIQNDLLDGLSVGVSATPTFFVNGFKIEGSVTFEAWETFIKDFLTQDEQGF